MERATGYRARELNRTYSDLNRKFEEQTAQRKAAGLSLPYFNLFGFPINQSALRTITAEEASGAAVIPFYKDRESLRVGVVAPGSAASKELFKKLTDKNYKIEAYLISESALKESLKQYKKVVVESRPAKSDIAVQADRGEALKLKNFPGQGARLLRVSATELLATIVGAAVFMRASDIHIEPGETGVKIRLRIDGVLQEVSTLPLNVWKIIISRVKLLSGLKLNVTASPQEGRMSVQTKGRSSIDLRISVLPTAYGESVVIRLLGLQEVSLQMENLGMSGNIITMLKKELAKRSGMILTTGPTGSGKTTSLYSFLNFVNRPGVKIVTIEEPVEYRLEGIVQTSINKKKGIDFAASLRAIVRQDPDVIMVGEIRDFDTAETAVQAALTGHLVFSTLHTNDAAGSILRLLDFGVKPITLAPALNALIAQRLLRKLCGHCKDVYRPGPDELRRVKLALAQISPKSGVEVPGQPVFYHSSGCVECHGLGYEGRAGIFEAFSVDEPMERLIYKQPPAADIKKAAVAAGMITLQQDAILKALDGVTDLAEVWRVTEE